VQYHFRSIDTWLDGVLRSHCDEHPWQSDALSYVDAAGKRSIFCSAEEEQDVEQGHQQQDCAGGDDEPELNFVTCTVAGNDNELDTSTYELQLPADSLGLPTGEVEQLALIDHPYCSHRSMLLFTSNRQNRRERDREVKKTET